MTGVEMSHRLPRGDLVPLSYRRPDRFVGGAKAPAVNDRQHRSPGDMAGEKDATTGGSAHLRERWGREVDPAVSGKPGSRRPVEGRRHLGWRREWAVEVAPDRAGRSRRDRSQCGRDGHRDRRHPRGDRAPRLPSPAAPEPHGASTPPPGGRGRQSAAGCGRDRRLSTARGGVVLAESPLGDMISWRSTLGRSTSRVLRLPITGYRIRARGGERRPTVVGHRPALRTPDQSGAPARRGSGPARIPGPHADRLKGITQTHQKARTRASRSGCHQAGRALNTPCQSSP